MNHPYFLSNNKENELNTDKSPLKMKINYQDGQRYQQRSKGPLGEQSLNQRNQLNDNDNTKSPLKSNQINASVRCVQQSKVQPFSMATTNTNMNKRQSSFDLARIKPKSVHSVNKRALGMNQANPSTNVDRKGYTVHSKGSTRQNSKHLQFTSKVNNLQKMSSQISSLLSYAYEDKSAKKAKNIRQRTPSYKTTQEGLSQNPKSYQPRPYAQQRPIQTQPNISRFQVQSNHNILSRTPSYQYEYSNGQVLSRTPSSKLNDHGEDSRSPDTRAYQESLKKGGGQIGRFKRKLFGSLEDENKNIYQYQDKYNLKTQLTENINDYDITSPDITRQPRNININPSERDSYFTQQQIQVYEDLGRLNNSHQRTQFTLRQQIFSKFNQQNTIDSQHKQILPRAQRKSQRKLYRQQESSKSRRCFYAKNTGIDGPQSYVNKLQNNAVVLRLDQKIKQIKNQLHQCKREKSHLSKRYQDLFQNHHQDSSVNNLKEFVNQRNRYYRQSRQPNLQFNQDDSGVHKSQRQIQRLRELPVSSVQNMKNGQLQVRNRLQMQSCYGKQYVTLQDNHLKNKRLPDRQAIFHGQSEKSTQIFSKTPKTSQIFRNPKSFTIQLKEVQITKFETAKLGLFLAEKIEIDLKLRQHRQIFMGIKNSNKWSELKEHFQSRYKYLKNEQQWQKLLSISSQEQNPFSPTQQLYEQSSNKFGSSLQNSSNLYAQSMATLCSLYSQSAKYFQQKLLHGFSSQLLNKQHFSFGELDLSFKGYLSLQDLICFVNLQSEKFYRNRDIIFTIKHLLLQHGQYNRLKGEQKCRIENQKNSQSLVYSGGSNNYKLGYQFLWVILTDQTHE